MRYLVRLYHNGQYNQGGTPALWHLLALYISIYEYDISYFVWTKEKKNILISFNFETHSHSPFPPITFILCKISSKRNPITALQTETAIGHPMANLKTENPTGDHRRASVFFTFNVIHNR